MRKALPLLAVFVVPAVALALGGQRWIETNGQVPTTCAASSAGGDGLALRDVSACRATVRAVDGGTVNGGKLVPFYCEEGASSGQGWQEAQSAQVCSLDACSRVDGGCIRLEQMCEWKVSNPFGRVGVALYGLVGSDAGSGLGLNWDGGGYNVLPVVRLECYGANLGLPTGATP